MSRMQVGPRVCCYGTYLPACAFACSYDAVPLPKIKAHTVRGRPRHGGMPVAFHACVPLDGQSRQRQRCDRATRTRSTDCHSTSARAPCPAHPRCGARWRGRQRQCLRSAPRRCRRRWSGARCCSAFATRPSTPLTCEWAVDAAAGQLGSWAAGGWAAGSWRRQANGWVEHTSLCGLTAPLCMPLLDINCCHAFMPPPAQVHHPDGRAVRAQRGQGAALRCGARRRGGGGQGAPGAQEERMPGCCTVVPCVQPSTAATRSVAFPLATPPASAACRWGLA